jgi:ABC-type transport system substrate-binding protein
MNQEKRKALCSEVQKILAEDVPYLPMCFNDVVSAHRRSLGALDLPSTGNYNCLTALHPNHNQSNKIVIWQVVILQLSDEDS